MIDVGVDSGVQMVNSSNNTDRVNQTDRNIQARPQTSDVGIDNTQQTADVGIDNTPRMLDAETNMKNLDTEDQVEARSWVKNLFNANPNWVALRIKPIKRKTGKDDNRYFLGEKGSLIATKTGRKSKTYQSIDWVATEEKIRDIWYDGESKSIDESSYMRLEDPLYHASLTRKRKIADPSEGDYADRTKQRLEDSFEFDTSTSTSLDQVDSKNRLLWSIFKNKAVLESTGLKKKIIPILKSMGKTSQMDKTGYVWIDGSSTSVFVKDRDDVDLFTNEDTTKLAKAFEPRDGEARHGIKIGIDEDMNSSLTNADNDAKKILMDYYSKIVSEGVRIPFRLKPIVDTKSGVKANQNYYFSEPTAAKPFYIRNHENKAVSGKVFNDLMKTIRWMDTFNSLMTGFEDFERYVYENDDPALKKNLEANLQLLNRAILDNTKSTDTSARIKSSEGPQYRDDTLQKLHDESEAAFLKYGKAQRKYDEAKRAIKGNNSKSARSALKTATAAMKATKAVYQIKPKIYSDAKNYTDVDQFSDRQDERSVRQTVNNMVDQLSTTGMVVKRKLKGRGLRGLVLLHWKE
ncbi:hypothetical protein PC110_g21776 [Phytophthora cactorum]|uniref:Uncharacterized protein n=1 Tax=Phytophthora cactorum TaxID=29920 RepID=A0A329RBG0_9STRA|nr:hypothetical protein PC110_g21776 [Phytophthora cactorum]